MLAPQACAACGTALAPGARFCAGCGAAIGADHASTAPAPAARVSTATLVLLAIGTVAAVAALVWLLGSGSTPPAPNAVASPSVAAPDISDLTPREQFQRLADRVQRAIESSDRAEAERFLPMTEQAYQNLLPGDRDIDARFHMALLRAQSGNPAGAVAEIDTIMATSPDHLFGHYLTAVVAERQQRAADAAAAHAAFVQAYDAQLALGYPEYDAHLPLLEQFRQQPRTVP